MDKAHLEWINDFYSQVYQLTGGVPDPKKDPTNNVDGMLLQLILILTLTGRLMIKAKKPLKLYFSDNLPPFKGHKEKRWPIPMIILTAANRYRCDTRDLPFRNFVSLLLIKGARFEAYTLVQNQNPR